MNSVVFVVLVSFVVLAPGVDNTPLTNGFASINLTNRDDAADILLLQNFLLSCPDVAPLFGNCQDQNDYNNNPGNKLEECESSRIAYGCWNSSIAATTCPDKEKAIDVLARLEHLYLPACNSKGNVVAAFLLVIILTCVSLLY